MIDMMNDFAVKQSVIFNIDTIISTQVQLWPNQH